MPAVLVVDMAFARMLMRVLRVTVAITMMMIVVMVGVVMPVRIVRLRARLVVGRRHGGADRRGRTPMPALAQGGEEAAPLQPGETGADQRDQRVACDLDDPLGA